MQCPLKADDRRGEAYRQASEAILAYGAGALPAVDTTAFRQHLNTCAECKQTIEAQREVWSALDSWTPNEAPSNLPSNFLPSNFDERLYARIGAYERQSGWSRVSSRVWRSVANAFSPGWSWKPIMPIAVACTALIVASLMNSPVPKHLPPPSVQQTSDTGVDLQQIERALDDLDMLKQFGLTSPQAGSKPLRTL